MTLRVGLAVNPTSGRGLGRRAGSRAARVLRAAGLDVVALTAAGGPELADLTSRALARGDLAGLVVVGGDGMVNLGVNATAGGTVPLGIIAAGTGNDVARGLGLPVRAPEAAARAVVDGLASPRRRRFDAVRCRTSSGMLAWYAGVLGAGFDAVVNERANRWSWPRGRLRYPLAIARELPVFRPRRYRLELDGEAWETSAMLVAVANCPSYGGGMRICPAARPDDGLLDVLVVGPISRTELIRIFPRVYAGTHLRHPGVVVRRARRVSVTGDDIVGYADGERLARLPVHCEIVPGAVPLLAAPVTAGDRRRGPAAGLESGGGPLSG